jgi:hypothetical protein
MKKIAFEVKPVFCVDFRRATAGRAISTLQDVIMSRRMTVKEFQQRQLSSPAGFMRCKSWSCVVEISHDQLMHDLRCPVIRPWQCMICNLRFTEEADVTAHVKKDKTHLDQAKELKGSGQSYKNEEKRSRQKLFEIDLARVKASSRTATAAIKNKSPAQEQDSLEDITLTSEDNLLHNSGEDVTAPAADQHNGRAECNRADVFLCQTREAVVTKSSTFVQENAAVKQVSVLEKAVSEGPTRAMKVQNLREKLVTTEHPKLLVGGTERQRRHRLVDNKVRKNLTPILSSLVTDMDAEKKDIVDMGEESTSSPAPVDSSRTLCDGRRS